MYSLQYRPQVDYIPYPENEMGGGGEAAAPPFLHIYYGPSVACTVGCTWLMYSLCMAHIWPMYDLHMAKWGSGDLSNIGHIWPCQGLTIYYLDAGLPGTVALALNGRYPLLRTDSIDYWYRGYLLHYFLRKCLWKCYKIPCQDELIKYIIYII